jgi:transposase
MRPHGNHQQLETRRRQAIALLRAKMPYRDVAQKVKASLSSVVRWYQSYRHKGPQGLRSRASWGRPSLLGAQQKTVLERKLLQGATAAGYDTDLWTLKRVARLIQTTCGVRYTEPGVWRLLHQDLGWSCQKPEKRALQRDEAAIAAWKRRTWPGIKKSPKTWRPPGLRRRKRVPAHPQRP